MTRLIFAFAVATTVGCAKAPTTSSVAKPPAKVDEPQVEEFVQLFNGKDLTGWKTHPDDKDCKWEVIDGVIQASGKIGHLYSERGDFEDFVYRMEAKINDKGNSGQYFRAPFVKSFPTYYEAQINATHSDKIRTGSLYPHFNRKLTDEQKQKILVYDAKHKPDEWFTQEVKAIGNHIVIKVNGETTVDFVDETNKSMKGHFAIQFHDPTCKIQVRKVEVKEIPKGK